MGQVKKIGFSFVFIFSSHFLAAQDQGLVDLSTIPSPPRHYLQEYDLDKPVDPAAWTQVRSGLHAAFGSENVLYFRAEVPMHDEEPGTWQATGWKGERLNTQIVVWSADTLHQIRVRAGELKNANGRSLPSGAVHLFKVCYVLSNYPYNASNTDCGEGPMNKAFLMPDRFEPLDRFDLPGKTARPIWVSVDVPAGTGPGKYSGKIEIASEENRVQLDIIINVQNQLLPAPRDWRFRLDLWQNPWVIADYFHVKPWSAEHMALLKQHLKLYAGAGGSFITTYGVHSPWGGNEYYIEGGMIDWNKRKDGSWKFNYTIFDKYVELAMSVGITKAITVYTPLPWGEQFRYFDERTGNYVYERWQPGSDTFRTNWNIFLTDLKKHLEQKGWFKKTYLGVNENAMDQTLAAIHVIRAHSKDWKITYAGDWHKELDTLLDDYCSVSGKEPSVYEVRVRSQLHRTSTFYICCTPPKPNTFLFSPPVEGRWLGWYAYAHSYDGFLRWAYDSWPGDPLRDGRYIYWPAGDCFLVYPGGNSGIRFEKLREGIVDYEKIRILKNLAQRSSNTAIKHLASSLDTLLAGLNTEKGFKEEKLKEDLNNGIRLVDELSTRLGN